MSEHDYRINRDFLKDSLRKRTDFSRTDQNLGRPMPEPQKTFDPGAPRIALAEADQWQEVVRDLRLDQIIANRKSRRKYAQDPLLFEELSFLLWATQGLRSAEGGAANFRTVPSAGARHSFETYLVVHNVEKLSPGLYRFLPLNNELLFIKEMPRAEHELSKAAFGQRFIAAGAVTFIWSCLPYRMEWRYGPNAYRTILMDVGHVCQNLYLACEAIGGGTCAVAAYDQEAMDSLLGLDGHDEFTLYLAPVGRIPSVQ
ncbi:MAG: SagB/ThcOx family dehydrogenase [Desulfohalobiaceae bacterium]